MTQRPTNYSPFYDPILGNIEVVLSKIKANHIVLDIGGWWKPFNRANYVIDYLPYDTRGEGGYIGPEGEHFTRESWIVADICAKPFPFKDKHFDFVYCGNVLEDVRDPVFVCQEIMRVGKAGYIECPTIWIECQRGIDDDPLSSLYPGFRNHRWLVDVSQQGLRFIPKLSILSALQLISETLIRKHITNHMMWTFGYLWIDHFNVNVWVYPERNDYIATLTGYFDTFDYSNLKSLYGNLNS